MSTITVQVTPEFIADLKKLAKRECWNEDEEFNAMDFSGGNFDDAYEGGYADGEADIAVHVLNELGLLNATPEQG